MISYIQKHTFILISLAHFYKKEKEKKLLVFHFASWNISTSKLCMSYCDFDRLFCGVQIVKYDVLDGRFFWSQTSNITTKVTDLLQPTSFQVYGTRPPAWWKLSSLSLCSRPVGLWPQTSPCWTVANSERGNTKKTVTHNACEYKILSGIGFVFIWYI